MEEVKAKKRSREVDMLHGPLLKKIVLFALPILATGILQQLFNAADVAVLGRFDTSEALAAVGSVGPVIGLLVNLFLGLSTGANVVLASLIGSGEGKRIPRAMHSAFSIAIISGFFLLIVGQFVARPMLTLMNTPKEIIDLAVKYLKIYFTGMPFMLLYNFGAAVLRSKGDSHRPLICLVFGGILNVGLNLLLVIYYKMSVSGVAIATVMSNVVCCFLILWFLSREEGVFHFEWKKLCLDRTLSSRIIYIGAPAGLQGVVFSISNVCIQSALNGFGYYAVAGSSAAVNFEFLSYFILNAFDQATTTFTSQNYAAGEAQRCKKIFRECFWCGFLSILIFDAALVLTRTTCIQLFSQDPQVIHYALIRMVIVISTQPISATYEISGSTLRGMGHSMLPALITILGTCVIRLIWVYLLFPIFSTFEMLLIIYPISWIITGIAMTGFYYHLRKKDFALLPEKEQKN